MTQGFITPQILQEIVSAVSGVLTDYIMVTVFLERGPVFHGKDPRCAVQDDWRDVSPACALGQEKQRQPPGRRPGPRVDQLLSGFRSLDSLARRHRQSCRRSHGHCSRRPRGGVLDVGHCDSRRRERIYRVDPRPAFQGEAARNRSWAARPIISSRDSTNGGGRSLSPCLSP